MQDELRIAPPAGEADRAWLSALWQDEWGGEVMVTRGQKHSLADMQALIAWLGEERVGAATYLVSDSDCELLSINAKVEGKGVGTALLTAVEGAARGAGTPSPQWSTFGHLPYRERFLGGPCWWPCY